ncbi:AarF/UbiB family protein [soil metagenome]
MTAAPRGSAAPGFRGPFAEGPPADALTVEIPPLEQFGITELCRMAVIYIVLVVWILRALAGRMIRPAGRTWFAAGSAGAVDAFEHLGPTFVKLGQVIASSPGVFPATLAAACQRCLDEVPPFDGETARRMITEDLGRSPDELFAEFDAEPLSAASIGQVHACVLPDGRAAVVKLQRPDIRARMTTDLRIMFRLAHTFERTRWGRSANATAAIRDLHAVTFQELNPVLEAWRQDRFRANIGAFGDNEWVTVPEIHWAFCGPRMICMARVSGVPLDEFEELRARGVDGELVLRRGAKVWVEAVCLHGPFHGDMHAGNIWVLDDGRGCFLDFGIVGELSDPWKGVIKDIFFTTMIDQDFTRVARAYRRLGVFPPDLGTDEEIGDRLAVILGPMLRGGMGQVSLGSLITSSIDLLQQYQATAPQELMLIAKQLLYIERFTAGLGPDYVLARDLFLIKNIFPEAVEAAAAELGVEMPE